MQIVINHLTRMQTGFICVAGVDIATNRHVRPVLATRLTADLHKRAGGVFGIGELIDLDAVRSCGTAPETEDHAFDLSRVKVKRSLSKMAFWRLLTTVAQDKLQGIFGRALHAQKDGCAVDEGSGRTSLGCLHPAVAPVLYINRWDKLRARVSDGAYDVDLSVTDLRLYEDDQKTVRGALLKKVQGQIESGVKVILSVGLARAFQAGGDTARRHWLQVNNVHLEDDPTWA